MKYALVTGAASDIGKSISFFLAKNNYNLILLYHDKELNYLEELIENKIVVKTYKVDITNEEEIKNTINTVDKIDVLINIASISMDNYIKDKTKEEFMKVLEVNLLGTFLVTKYAVNKMDNGTVINLSSLDSTKTFNSLSVDYIASKAGVNTLTKTFAIEYKDIRFITLLLPWIRTSSVLEMNPLYLKEEMDKYNQDRLMEVDEVSEKIIEVINSDTKSGTIVEVNYD